MSHTAVKISFVAPFGTLDSQLSRGAIIDCNYYNLGWRLLKFAPEFEFEIFLPIRDYIT